MTKRNTEIELARSPKISLIIGAYDGHREVYFDLFSHLLPSSVRVPVSPPLHTLWGARDPILFLTLDDHPLRFVIAATLRSVVGRRTVALFLRPGECFLRGRLKCRLKRVIFRVVSKLPRTAILTILPFSVEPRFAQVATDWIADPHLWDLSVIAPPQATGIDELPKTVRDAAAGRCVVLALGGQSRIKGFDFFSHLWCHSAQIRKKFLFCAAGAVAPECKSAMERMRAAGGLVIDRRLENIELLNLYEHADIVWSVYAPDYDQASGIFGRAFQFDIPSIVRLGSFLDKLAVEYDYKCLAVPFDDSAEAAARLLTWKFVRRDPTQNRRHVNALRARSLKILEKSLLTYINTDDGQS